MIRCTQPGCTGTVEDGYCVECGMAPGSAAPGASPASAPASRCAQPGCDGTVEDGYCTTCGMAPASTPVPSAVPRAAVPEAAAPEAAAPEAAPGDRCGRPGCDGVIEDGYCSTCGSPPASRSTGAAGAAGVTTGSSISGSVRSARSVRTGSTRSRSSGRGMLGAGLVEVPRVPYRDPATAIKENPEVAEHKRFCSGCGEPVGRARGGRPGRTEGFCPNCGAGYSFTPKLKPDDLVGGQYEVLGCLAHGGLGWIYLARDLNVNKRWVVLKGLLDTGDADALAAAAAERAFLAEVEHPNIVKIINFVQHGDSGYIVMEYVGGKPLKDVLLERRQAGEEALPLGQAIAYGLELLRALGYLHGLGLLYCDLKPDNAIQSDEQLKLIDLGGVRRLDDTESAIYGTVGYQAPEIADEGPSVSSDLYTVGRTLAVLSFPFKHFTTTYAERLPDRAEIPLLQRFESYDRLLRRATHIDPAARFSDATDMADQLTGVLREVLSAEDGRPRPGASSLFGMELRAIGTELAAGQGSVLDPPSPAEVAVALPTPLVDGTDPAAGFLAGLTSAEPEQLVAALSAAPDPSPEVRLTLARVRVELGDIDEAHRLLEELAADRPGDWRIPWYGAVAVLASGDVARAEGLFDEMYSLLPGEAPPKLALAYCRAHRGDHAGAADLYERVWRTDNGYISAAFGLARARLAAGDRTAAVAVLDSVPTVSSHHVAAQVAAVATAIRGRSPAELTEPDLVGAGGRLTSLKLDGEQRGRLIAEVLETALDWARAAGGADRNGTLFEASLTERALRGRLEETYRALARLADTPAERHALVVRANAARPRTLI
jgi:serine/threonine-protein kinase PknG